MGEKPTETQNMSTQKQQFRSRRTGETEWFKPPYPARGDMNWEAVVTAPPTILAGRPLAALPAVMPATPAAPVPTTVTQELIEKVLAIVHGERTCLDVPPQRRGVQATAADIVAAMEKAKRPADADMPLTGLAKQVFEAREKLRNLGNRPISSGIPAAGPGRR